MSMNVQTCPNCRIEVELTEIGRCPRCRELVELTVTNAENNPYQTPENVSDPRSLVERQSRLHQVGLNSAIISILAAVWVMLVFFANIVAWELQVPGPMAAGEAANVIVQLLLISGAVSGVIGLIGGIRSRSYFAIAIACVGCLFHVGPSLTVLMNLAMKR